MKKLFLFSVLALTGMLVQAQVTYTVTVPTGTNACYIAGEMNNWSPQEMTLSSANTYSITIAGATTSQTYKYLSGPNWAYEEKQADCSSGVSNRTYAVSDVVACWAAVYVPTAPKVDVTIKVKVPVAWTTPKIHFWGDMSSSWPGENMTQDGDWWVYTFSQINIINIIFNNGAGSQTSNITNVSASTCYQVNDDNSFQVVSCTPVVPGKTYNVTVPTGTNACYIAGSMNSWGFEQMTQLTPTTYTITLPTATDSDTYRYLSGPGWAWEEVQSDCSTRAENRSYSVSDVVACWKGVYDPATVAQDYVYNVTVPTGTLKCYINGNFSNWGSFLEMTKLTETTYTITISTTTPNGYKFASGPAWDYVELQSDGSDVGDRTYNQANTVALWKALYDPTITSVSQLKGSTLVKGIQSGIHIETTGTADVAVYSLQGSLLKQVQVNQQARLSDLQAGVYLLRINGQTYKAIVQ